MIEFGAGPFTQSLTIFQSTARRPRSIALLEPMAEHYMKTVDACRYKNGKLDDIDTNILAYPAEKLVPTRRFDTILLLNVIEHVMDAFLIYKIAFQALRPGGLVIFHERFWPGYDGTETKNKTEFDLHPIRLNERMAHWMATEFDLLYEKEQTERWGNTGYYWIGRKHAVPMERLVGKLRDRMDAHTKQLSDKGWHENAVWGNIYNGRDLEQSREYMAYARSTRVKTICEIGFAGGHSTIAYMTANSDATIYSFDDFGKPQLTQLAYDILKQEKADLHLQRGDSTKELPKFSASNPDVFCDIISVDGAHHAHFPDVDLKNFKYLANYPNVVLIDDYHQKDWPAVYSGVSNRVGEGSMKVRHVAASSIIFRNKQKQWAIGEYTLLTVVVATMDIARFQGLKALVDIASNHPVVQNVVIIWNGPNMPSEVSQLARNPNGSARITVVQRDVNSLNNRYDPNLPIHTGAVMVLDDDISITKETIDCAFGAWKRDPSRLYSFGEGRSVSSSGYGYQTPIGESRTNFLLPRMIFHRKFLSVYFDTENQDLRNYVDTQGAHCDDIAFTSVVTKYSQKPLVFVPAPHKDLRSPGLGYQKNRLNLRAECSKEIVSMLDWTMPTVESGKC